MADNLTIRPIAPADRAGWDRLYAGCAAFTLVTQTDATRHGVWSWLISGENEMNGLVAEDAGGNLIGLAHFRPFARPLSASIGGFLDDLFVDPDARGSGAADALMEALKAEGVKRGWSIIRWITAEDNYRARKLYDRMAEKTRWVTYDIKL